MEESSGRTEMSRPREDPSEWKAKFTPDLRRKVVQKILDFIRMPPEARSQMTKVIEQFEEGLFRSAISQEDYLQKISRKLKLIDHKSSHSNAGVSSPSKPVLNQNSMVAVRGQSSSLKNVYQAPSKVAGDSVGQGMQSNISADNQRNGLGTRQDQHQQSQQQLLTHNIHQPYAGNLCIEDILSVHCYQQQQNIASQSNSFQFSQNQTLNTESQQPPFSEQSSAAVFQPNQLVPQGNNIGQQLSPFQKTMPNSYQQPDGLQSNASCLQQQHRVTGAELKVMNMKSHEHSAHILQVEDTSLPSKVEQSVQSVNNFHQLLYSPKQSKKETTHQRPDTLAAMVTPRIVNNQQNVLPAVKNMTEVSSVLSPVPSLETGAPSEQANMAEFHDQMYQKFQAMRKEYLPWLTHVYNKLNEKCQKPPIPEIYKKKIKIAEKLIKLLSSSRGDLFRCSMSHLEYYHLAVKQFLHAFKKENSVSAQQCTQLQPSGGQSQMPQLNSALTGKPVGQSPLSSTQQVIPSSQPNMMNLPRSGSLFELEQQNASSSLQDAARPEGHDIGGAQQIKSSNGATGRSFYPETKLPPQNFVKNAFPQQRQLKHQMRQTENVRQQMQPQFSQKKMQHMQMANIKPVATSDMLQQNPLISQQADNSHQMPLPTTPHHFQYPSQMSQHSSAQVYQKNLPLALSKLGTPSYSANSPSITSSPSIPFTPFSIPADSENHPSDISSLLISRNLGHPQRTLSLNLVDTENEIATQFLPVAQAGISASSFPTESSSPNYEQQSSAVKEPLERLLNAVCVSFFDIFYSLYILDQVQSLSPKTLSASVREIGSALKTVDAISGTACNDSGVDVDENLVSATTCCMHGRNFSLQSGCSSEAKMEDKTNPIALDETDSIKQSAGQIWDIDTSRIIKRRRVEPSNTLLDEIKCINQWLIETEIDLDSSEDPSALDAGEGTIVRCVYSAVALDENFKMQFASQILPLPLRLFVPASYPNASPVILGGLSFDWSGESIGSINLSEKTRSRFSLSLRKLSEPMSLAEMAMTWDICARTVLLEYAQSVDGGCFSSKYGKWENCVTA
ncbi:Mediator of RNA polymerase II transcription subunit 15a [Citrus sinensis]|nr:Mediator of RNA polymerase II transcription subunit 15a [Citrus sinensis]